MLAVGTALAVRRGAWPPVAKPWAALVMTMGDALVAPVMVAAAATACEKQATTALAA
jgi:hypothetical protein